MQVIPNESIVFIATASEWLLRLLPAVIGASVSRGKAFRMRMQYLWDESLDALYQAPKTTTMCGVGLFLALLAHPCGTRFYAWAADGGRSDLQAGAALILPALGTLIFGTVSVALHQNAIRTWREPRPNPTTGQVAGGQDCASAVLDCSIADEKPVAFEAPLRFFASWVLGVFLVWGMLFLLKPV